MKSYGFCNTTNHTANKCPTISNIGQIIDRDVLVEILQYTCPFKVIECDQCTNVFRKSLDFTRIQHLKWHEFQSIIIPCMNKRPDVDNLFIKVIFYTRYGLPITRFVNSIYQSPLIVSYIHNKMIPNQHKYLQRWAMNVPEKFLFIYKKR